MTSGGVILFVLIPIGYGHLTVFLFMISIMSM